jgi:hypothetical protein
MPQRCKHTAAAITCSSTRLLLLQLNSRIRRLLWPLQSHPRLLLLLLLMLTGRSTALTIQYKEWLTVLRHYKALLLLLLLLLRQSPSWSCCPKML